MEARCDQYTTDLLRIRQCTPLSYVPTPNLLSRIVTPLKLRYESGGVHLFCILIGNRHIIRYGVSGRVLELALIARVPSGPQGVTCHRPESKQQ